MLMLVLVLGLVVAACSSPPTADGEEDAGAAGSDDAGSEEAEDPESAQSALDEVVAELEGLEGDERRERLVELAQEEGEVSFYGSTNIDDIGPILEQFEDDTEISVSHYRAGASTVLNRILQEADAGFAGSDVVQINGPEMNALDGEGLLLELDTPIRDEILEAGRQDTWLAPYVNAFIVGWNSDRVPEGEEPTSYEDVFTNFSGTLAMEVDDFDWFMTLVDQYFTEEKGMSEEEAVDLFKEAASGASLISGHSVGSELLVAGEYDVHSSIYHHHLSRFPDSPLEWQPPIEPIVVRPNGVGIMATTSRPAASLLMVEYMLTDGQPLLAEVGRTPGNMNVDGGLEADVETLGVDLEKLDKERDKWVDLYDEVIKESGSEIRE